MPFLRPTLTELHEQALTDIATAMQLRAVLRFRPEYAMGTAQAGLANGLYEYLDWIALQSNPATATGEYLHAWAALKGVFPYEATGATGSATFPGTPGALLPVGTPVSREDGSALYATTADATVGGGGTVTAPIAATTLGPAGNALTGTALRLAAAVSGVTSVGTAAGPLTGGADAEGDEALRTRMFLAYAEPAQGGAARDYLDWALAVPGVTRAWVASNELGVGTVTVRFMRDEANAGTSGFPVGAAGVAAAETRDTPATGDQLAVANAIYPLRPATALVYAVAPTDSPVAFRILNLSRDTAAIRTAIAAALTQALRDFGEPGGTIYPSTFTAAIDAVPGVERFTLQTPAAPLTMATGALPTLGAISWV